MTIKLYDVDAYKTTFEANVLSCIKENEYYDVILDKTCFFPEEGGQTCDKGTINGHIVYDVQIAQDTIHHYMKEEVSGLIQGEIDFDHRYNNMQNHTGEHILSGIIHSTYGYDNVGFHLSDEEVTADFNGVFTETQIREIEDAVNAYIYKNRQVICTYPENVEEIEYRSKKEIDGAIRIVEIEGLDFCACCAPHVKSTAEVGIFKITKYMKHRKGTRIFFVCGKRAYKDYQQKYNETLYVSNLLAAPINEISKSVQRIYDENIQLKQQINALKKESIQTKVSSLSRQDSIILFEDTMDMNIQRFYLNQLEPYYDTFAAIFVEMNEGYRFLLASKTDATIYLKTLKEHFTIKGGGKKDMVQGTIIATKEDILNIIK